MPRERIDEALSHRHLETADILRLNVRLLPPDQSGICVVAFHGDNATDLQVPHFVLVAYSRVVLEVASPHLRVRALVDKRRARLLVLVWLATQSGTSYRVAGPSDDKHGDAEVEVPHHRRTNKSRLQ